MTFSVRIILVHFAKSMRLWILLQHFLCVPTETNSSGNFLAAGSHWILYC